MKKPSLKILLLWFAIASCFVTLLFGAYLITQPKLPVTADVITAYVTALAFAGFVVTAIYQAACSIATDAELARDKKRSERLRHDSLWLTVQIARLHTFTELDDRVNMSKTMGEIEGCWGKLSKEHRDQQDS